MLGTCTCTPPLLHHATMRNSSHSPSPWLPPNHPVTFTALIPRIVCATNRLVLTPLNQVINHRTTSPDCLLSPTLIHISRLIKIYHYPKQQWLLLKSCPFAALSLPFVVRYYRNYPYIYKYKGLVVLPSTRYHYTTGMLPLSQITWYVPLWYAY